MTTVPTTIRAAAVLVWVSAIGLGVPCLMAMRNLLAGRPIPRVLGYPAYGEGPFEHHGIVTTPLLISAFLAVCLLEAVAAASLWGGHKLGAVLAHRRSVRRDLLVGLRPPISTDHRCHSDGSAGSELAQLHLATPDADTRRALV
jgi:hypothetical protein